MFGSSSTPGKDTKEDEHQPESHSPTENSKSASIDIPGDGASAPDKRSSASGSPPKANAHGNGNAKSPEDSNQGSDKKRRSSGVSRARDMFNSAKQTLHLQSSSPTSSSSERSPQTPIQRLSKTDPALSVPQGSQNNSAGDSLPGSHSTFRVGVTEDKNKKCRRTMEDTHAYLYNFLSTPQPLLDSTRKGSISTQDSKTSASDSADQSVVETDNGYFAIFDGHAGTFAADWCGKKLHLLLEDAIRKHPNTPIPELLDQTFTNVDQQLEKLPLKNSGCTAVIAVLRWEDRVPNSQSATGSTSIAPLAAAASAKAAADATADSSAGPDAASAGQSANKDTAPETADAVPTEAKLREVATRQRVLYTANVGDARIVLCRKGRALRLSYDHKGSDENEGRRIANAGGLILNNRVNGVLAVTRALGDAYMKDLVTGHPYTTETVIQPDQDEFIILACDGLWDVCSDQEAVDLVRNIKDPQAASKSLVDHALARFSTDNLSCMIVRFDNEALLARQNESNIGVDGDPSSKKGGISETESILGQAKKHIGDIGEADIDQVSNEMILEEEEAEPGPELNPEALKAARKDKV
ncbi:phosphatase 2C-like domain-containing protein [Phyllosticta citrichinensis]|uniref:Phosphatase 2C-like domain-containing protein n=1 Tax=Phyllosticta citrichinensis TaxID=1130410 RepID=A0ABR1XJ95_9PEZI